MTRSMRSRFQEPTPPPRRQPEPEDEGGKASPLNRVGQIAALALALGIAYVGYDWLAHDISGQYQGLNQELGPVMLTIVSRANGLTGDIIYANGAPLAVAPDSSITGNTVSLKFTQAPQLVPQGRTARTSTLQGQIQGGQISGTLEESGYQFKVDLTRNYTASLMQEFQAHMP